VEHVDELIAAHALHALDPDDQRLVDAHLATCDRCRAQLRELEGVAAALAYAAPAAQPPSELRVRLLEEIAPTVVSGAPEPALPRSRWSWWPRFSAVAVPVLGVAVVALALWNISLRGDGGGRGIRSVAAVDKVGSVVSYQDGQATLVGSLRAAPAGHIYEAWVIPRGQQTPIAAGTFHGGQGISFTLTRDASAGDTIVITLEPGSGGPVPRGPAVGKTVLAAA
jgi:anti-sigma-K factor RskA